MRCKHFEASHEYSSARECLWVLAEESVRLIWGRLYACACRDGCPLLIDMFLSIQLPPRSARSSRRKCNSAASSCPGKNPSNPTVSSQNMKSNTMKKWVCSRFVCAFVSLWNLFSPFTFTFADTSFCIQSGCCCEWNSQDSANIFFVS